MKELIQIHKAFSDIKFKEQNHTYKINGSNLKSVTSLISLYKKPFDSETVSYFVAKKRGIPQIEILAEWEQARLVGSKKGNLVHKALENHWSGKNLNNTEDLSEIQDYNSFLETMLKLDFQTSNFLSDFIKEYIPVKLELIVGDKDLGIAGQVDGLFYHINTGEFVIIDYKTEKKYTYKEKYGNFKKPIKHLNVCTHNKFSLQLSIYQYLLEKNTDIRISKRLVIWFHQDNDNYEVKELPYLKDEVESIIKHYNNEL